MKKLLSFLLIMCCLASTVFFRNDTTNIFRFENCEKVCFVSEKDFGFESQRSGDKIFSFCSYEEAKEVFENIKNDLDGIQFYFKGFDEQDFYKKFNARVVSKSQVEQIRLTCGYTPFFNQVILIDGKKVNFQIANTSDWVIVGFPLILTGY